LEGKREEKREKKRVEKTMKETGGVFLFNPSLPKTIM
jgi:hypothetical protein